MKGLRPETLTASLATDAESFFTAFSVIKKTKNNLLIFVARNLTVESYKLHLIAGHFHNVIIVTAKQPLWPECLIPQLLYYE